MPALIKLSGVEVPVIVQEDADDVKAELNETGYDAVLVTFTRLNEKGTPVHVAPGYVAQVEPYEEAPF